MTLFKDLIWMNLVEAALISLFAALPFLNFWPINIAIRYIAMEMAEYLYTGLDQFIDVELIKLKNETLHQEFVKASTSLKIIGRGYGIESEEFKNARVDHKEHLKKFLRTGPSAA